MTEIHFCDRRWTVRPTGVGGPGSNLFDDRNVTQLDNGDLQLEVTNRDGKWTCAELHTLERLGFGTYQLWLIGRIDSLDPQLVFAFFSYPTADVGPDKTHEIDIELARWGAKEVPCGNFTVYPTSAGGHKVTHPYPIRLEGEYTTHRIVRRAESIVFSSYHGHRELGDPRGLIEVREFTGQVSRAPMPLHLNFWLYEGKQPQNGKTASLIVRDVQFVESSRRY